MLPMKTILQHPVVFFARELLERLADIDARHIGQDVDIPRRVHGGPDGVRTRQIEGHRTSAVAFIEQRSDCRV
jgi:hypothetical protein